MSRAPIRHLAALGLLLAAAAFPAQAEESPRALVMQATDRLMSALLVSGDEIRANFALAHRLAEGTVLPLVDFDAIGRRVLGRHWREANADQRAAYREVFRRYAGNFLVTMLVQYSREIAGHADRVSFPPSTWRPGDERADVEMEVRLAGGAGATVTYRMRRHDDGWRVFDVALEGIGMVLTYRSTFAAEVRAYGLDGLIERMREYNQTRPG